MRGIKRLLGFVGIAGMMLASSAQVGAIGTNLVQSGLGGGAKSGCQVRISRNSAAGVFNITREVSATGACRCSVSTGPASQGGSIESALVALRISRSCATAALGSGSGRGPLGLGRPGGNGGFGGVCLSGLGLPGSCISQSPG